MAYYNDGKVFRNLPEQVEKNKSDIESIQDAQKTDESNINTNLNNINAHETRINALESLKMTQDGQNIKLTKSTGEIGNIAVGTVGGTNLLGGNDVTFKTINGEAITGEGNLTVDTDLSRLIWASLGIGRWRNNTFYNFETSSSVIYDNIASNYTSYSFCFANTKFETNNVAWGFISDWTCKFKWNQKDTGNLDTNVSFYCTFYNAGNKGYGITIPPRKISDSPRQGSNGTCMFAKSKFKFIKVAGNDDGTTGEFGIGRAAFMFSNCTDLEEISGFNFRAASRESYDTFNMFANCTALHSITNCKMPIYSFSLSDSPNFTAEEMTEVFNQLETISTGMVITINATVFDKLSTDQIAVATGKGWTISRV